MPSSIPSPARQFSIEPLSHTAFSSFGEVIEDPASSSSTSRTDLRKTTANNGSAQRWFDISRLTNFYNLAPSKKPSAPSLSVMKCDPRKLRPVEAASVAQMLPTGDGNPAPVDKMVFDINVLERHPYTSQTFIPLGLSCQDHSTRYLVIVAPTLPASKSESRESISTRPKPYPTPDPKPKRPSSEVYSRARPSPFTNETSPPTPQDPNSAVHRPKGRGLPDLDNVKVFLASGNQAVTYGAGTWHAPMVVVGQNPIDFVVVQNMNGVDIEDCQKVELESIGNEGLSVMLQTTPSVAGIVRSKL